MKTLIFKINTDIELPQNIINDAPYQGPFDDYAEYLLETYNIEVSLDDSIQYLKEYGAWTLEELQDLELNKARILWLACLNCKENNTNYFYMGL